jgi:hypothetical protein
MSHVATVEIEVEDLGALEEVCNENGWSFRKNQKTYKWYGKWVNDYHGDNAAYKHGINPKDYGKCEHAINVKQGAYEIGVVKNDKGKHVLIWDFWDKQVEQICGKGCHKLYESYSKKVATKKLKKLGFTLQSTKKNKNGEQELTFAKY